MSKLISYLIASILSLLVLGVIQLPDKNLHIIACDVGQGDAVLITKGFSQVLIDGGPSDKVQECLDQYVPWFDRNIEVLVLTHAQQDHLYGLIGVVERYNVGVLVANNVANNTKTFKQFQQIVHERGIGVVSSTGSESFVVGDLKLTSLWPRQVFNPDLSVWESMPSIAENYIKEDHGVGGAVLGAYDGDLNETSVVFRLEFNQVSAIFTGDLGTREELSLMGLGVIEPSNVLKVAHHGSKHSSSLKFLEHIRPELAMISVGKGNRYGHPDREVLTYLDMVGAKVLRTDEIGSIELVSDGISIWKEE